MGCFSDEIDAVQTVTIPQWISVKERMPEKSCQVLCYSESGEIFNAEYDSNIDVAFQIGFWDQYYDDTLGFYGEDWNPCDTVTHWMPLPEPPKENANAEEA